MMQQFTKIADFKKWRKAQQGRIAFVPTMGNLHQGHLRLVEEAQKHAEQVVVSIFVNPLQFGANEDFARYPRTLAEDGAKLQEMGVSALFTPEVAELYPRAQTVFVEPSPLQNELCGKTRQGHFRGVATVVLKLFNIVQADSAFFGKKDYQQWLIVRQMVEALNLAIKVYGVDTVREADGLAMSSRNQYLNQEERHKACALYQTLQQIAGEIQQGARDYEALCQSHCLALEGEGWQVDYLEVRDALDLKKADKNTRQLVILIAGKLGKTRLIDNLELSLSPLN